MSELRRLSESGDPQWRELLRYTKAEGTPSAQRIDALAARVVAELSAPSTGSDVVSSVAPADASRSMLKWLLGIVLLGALSFGAARMLERAPSPAQVPSAAAPTTPVRAPAPASQPSANVGDEAPVPAPFEPAQTAPAPRPRAQRRGEAPAAQLKSTNPTAEITLLKGARRTLLADPEAALALVEQHRREHPAGVFVEEREALAVEALWRAGERERAEERLRAMLALYPRSTYRERLTELLGRAQP